MWVVMTWFKENLYALNVLGAVFSSEPAVEPRGSSWEDCVYANLLAAVAELR